MTVLLPLLVLALNIKYTFTINPSSLSDNTALHISYENANKIPQYLNINMLMCTNIHT